MTPRAPAGRHMRAGSAELQRCSGDHPSGGLAGPAARPGGHDHEPPCRASLILASRSSRLSPLIMKRRPAIFTPRALPGALASPGPPPNRLLPVLTHVNPHLPRSTRAASTTIKASPHHPQKDPSHHPRKTPAPTRRAPKDKPPGNQPKANGEHPTREGAASGGPGGRPPGRALRAPGEGLEKPRA